MKAIVQDRFGGPEVLELRDVEEPVAGPGQVRISVRAAGAGPDVWHLMTGIPYMVRLMPGFWKVRNAARGRDVSGVVESVGPDLTDLAPGDEVMGIAEGTFAELAVARHDLVVAKPSRLTFEQAAAAPISGLTALQAIRDVARVRPGQRVLVIGAGGGVGTLTVQVAKAFGAHVTGVSSTSKLDLVRSLGADAVIDYTVDPLEDLKERWDALVDTAGRRQLGVLRRLLERGGIAAIVGGEGGGRWTGGFFRQALRAPFASMVGGRKLRAVLSKETGEDLRALAELIERGDVTPVVGRTFPLVEAAEAIRYLERGHAEGKIVVTV